MYRTTTIAGGKRIVIAGAAVSLFVSAGAAAAATGHAPWSDAAPGVVEPSPTEPAATDAPVVTDAALPAVTDAPADVVTTPDGQPAVTDAPATEPGSPTTTATADSTTEPTTANTTEPTMPTITAPAVTEPPATAAPTTSPTTAAPTTTEFHDTPVPLGISLTCTVDGNNVTCHWSGGQIPGFARFLLLRGNGGSQGRVPFQSTDPNAAVAIDANVPVGSYSYVVVAVDGNAKTLVHSNPVFIQIGAAN